MNLLKPAVWMFDAEGHRHPVLPLVRLRIPFYACLGQHEKLSIAQLNDLISDLTHERARRPDAD